MTVLDHAFFGVDPSDPDFDLPTAQAVYAWMRSDPAAPVIAKRALFHQINDDLDQIRPEVQLMIDEWGAERVAKALPYLKQQYVDDVMAGGTGFTQEVAKAVLEPIAKAGQFPYELTPQQRRENQRNQRRINGRYATMNRSIDYSTRPIPRGEWDKVPNRVTLNPNVDEKAQERHMMAMRQLSDMLDPVEGAGRLRNVTLTWSKPKDGRNPDENDPLKRVLADPAPLYDTKGGKVVQVGEAPPTATYQGTSQKQFQQDWDAHIAAGHRLEDVQVDFMEDFNLAGASFDTLRALGVQEESAGHIASQANRINQGNFNDFTDKWNKQSTASEPRARTYARVQAGAEALDAILPPGVGNEVKGAVKVAAFAGKYGQNAENLLGPQIQRQSYRYRGTEKKPAKILQDDLKFLRRETRGPDGGRADELARELFVLGNPVQGEGVQVGRRVVASSPVRDYLIRKLPDPNLLELHRESGRGTPSQGIIINQKGEIASEAVGMGEDHYLPFPGRAVKQMRGGEYIRTRAFGGPTTEDFETALMAGARAFTVVSNSGTFTVKFAPDFRGARRYNDKTRRMVKQYGNLLDSLQAEVVGFEVPEDRMRELRLEAKVKAGGKAHGAVYDSHLKDLQASELEAPQLSNEAKNAVYNQTLRVLGEKVPTTEGVGLSPDEYLENHAAMLQRNGDVQGLQDFRDAIAEADDRDHLKAERGRRAVLMAVAGPTGWDRYRKGVEAEERKNLQSTRKMRLDGRGYENALKAMKEQFPYYIVDARRIENPDTASESKGAPPKSQVSAKDRYYTRPGDTRPHQVRIGYHNAPNASVGGVQAGTVKGERRKMSAASEFGRKGNIGGVTDETDRSPKAAEQVRVSAERARAAGAANPKYDEAAAARRQERANVPAEVKEAEFDGWLEQRISDGGIMYNGKPMAVEHRQNIIDAMKVAGGQGDPAQQAQASKFLDSLQFDDPKVKSQFERKRRELGGKPAVQGQAPDVAQNAAKVKAATVKANPAAAPRVAEEFMRVEINYGPEYDFDRSPEEYEATYTQLMEQAAANGIQVDAPDMADSDAFQASVKNQLAGGFTDLAEAQKAGDEQAQTEALARIDVLHRLSRLGRAWDDSLAGQDDDEVPAVPLTGQPDAGTREREKVGVGSGTLADQMLKLDQQQAKQPVTNRGPNDGNTVVQTKPLDQDEEDFVRFDEMFAPGGRPDWGKFDRVLNDPKIRPEQKAALQRWADATSRGGRKYSTADRPEGVGKAHTRRLVRL